MKITYFLILFSSTMSAQIIYQFTTNSNPADWRIIDDVVMGGVSSGNFAVNNNGQGVFSGYVSTANNGGFSSVRYQFAKISTLNYSKITIRLKGDGKNYQFRIKDNKNAYYSYSTTFKTSGNWQIVTIMLHDLQPTFRGQKLNFSNFKSDYFEEIAFLAGNKKNESFQLIIDKIQLE
jgi:hypothetical protein